MPKIPKNRSWQKISELFEAALAQSSPRERLALLRRACGGDESLLAEVQSLLAVDDPAAVFFSSPLFDVGALAGSEPDPPSSSGSPSKDRSATAATTAVADFPPGTVLVERYRIVCLIGQGGMGRVYRAEDLKLQIVVALKFLPFSLERDPSAVRRFLEEARLARTVTHPNVCRVHDIGELEGLPFLSMEYVAGEDLASLLRRVGKIATEKAVEIGYQLASGLAAIHRQGVLHRDLKPANILFDERGQIRIADFGIALRRQEAAGALSIGTPAYMAPEVLAGEEASVRSDLYALGLVLFELVTGRRPFDGRSADELRGARHRTLLHDLGETRLPLNPEIERILLQCLEPDPARRPESAKIIASTLAGKSSFRQTVLRSLVAGRIGPPLVPALMARHGRLLERLGAQCQGERMPVETSGSDASVRFSMSFPGPGRALSFCFDYLAAMADWQAREMAQTARLAMHLSEVPVSELPVPGREAERSAIIPTFHAIENLTALCRPRQVLLTRPVFDLMRSGTVEAPLGFELCWRLHGFYEVAGFAGPIEIVEVKADDRLPFARPQETASCRRVESPALLHAWRARPEQPLPGRSRWLLERRLDAAGAEERWVARHVKTGERRLFRFSEDASRIQLYEQEIELDRLIKQRLGERQDFARVLDWSFDTLPYFVEHAYTQEGDLTAWIGAKGKLAMIPISQRLAIVARTATALQAIHSVGLHHGNLGPDCVLIRLDPDEGAAVCLCCFGSNAKERFYLAPELIEGNAATAQSDIYGLGVLLYQMVVGDLGRALAPGWQADLTDSLLAEDIARLIARQPAERMSAEQLVGRLASLESRRVGRRRPWWSRMLSLNRSP